MEVSRATARRSFAPALGKVTPRVDARAVLILIIVSLALAFGLAATVLYGTTPDPTWDDGIERMG